MTRPRGGVFVLGSPPNQNFQLPLARRARKRHAPATMHCRAKDPAPLSHGPALWYLQDMSAISHISQPRSLMIVEDDYGLAQTLSGSFRRRGFQVVVAQDFPAAMRLAAREVPDLAVVDLKLKNGSGLEVVAHLAGLEPRPKIVVLTGYASIATTVEAIKLGAVQYLAKPATVSQILAAFDHRPGAEPIEIGASVRTTALKVQEWETIQQTLAECDFNISEAARRLGMHRRTLARKLAKQPVR